LPKYVQFQTFQLHKSLGLTVLVLSILRLLWRLTHTPPPLPPGVPAFEVFAAKLTHWIFYGLMLALPLTGWAIVSTSSWGLPTIWFGLFEWPHLPGLAESVHKKELNDVFGETHEILAYIAIALIGLHTGAALKHHLWNRDTVLTRMLPFLRPLPPKVSS
jgi:cytochrome b561